MLLPVLMTVGVALANYLEHKILVEPEGAPALRNVMLLTLAHESMHAFRAMRIGMMLNELQQGGARDACITFTAIRNTYKPK